MKKSVLVHFSGGSDSTLAAALCAEKFEKVYLNTYKRFSFRGVKDVQLNLRLLEKIYGKDKFVHQTISVVKWYKKLAYENYLSRFKKYKTTAACVCVPCKLSMHWHSTLFCLKNGINYVADGTVPYMELYPDQNRKITTDKLRDYYKNFQISYITPVYEISEEVEQRLYDKGITSSPEIRGTTKDKQVYCAEQSLFAFFVKYFITRYGKQKYEEQLSQIVADKINFMQTSLEDYKKEKTNSVISKLEQ